MYVILMCISCFMFLLMNYYLPFILYVFQTRETMLGKKQIWAIFLSKFKMCHKTAETTCNINRTFGPGTANTGKVQWWFKKFCKGDERLGEEEHSGRTSEVGNNQLRANIEADPLKTTELVAQELNIDYSMVIWHLKQIGKVKKLDEWVASWADWKSKKKIIVLKYYLLLFYATTNHFSIGLWHETKSGFYMMVMTNSVVGPRRSSKALPKAKLASKKGSWSLVGGLLLIWSTPAF